MRAHNHCCNTDEDYGPPVAALTLQPSGNRVLICGHHIDMWLDNADDDPAGEPSRIEWLTEGSRG